MKFPFFKTIVSLAGLASLSCMSVSAQIIYSEDTDLSLKLSRTDNATISSNGPNETANPVGKSGAGSGFDRAAVFVFQIPDLGAMDNPFGSASLGLFLFQDTADAAVNGDLYGLGRRASSEVLLDDYYGREAAADPTDATLIQDNFLTAGGSPVNALTATSSEGSQALADYLNAQYEGGAGIGQYVFLRVNTDADTTRRWNFTSVNGANGDLSMTPQLSFLVASDPVDTIQVETAADGSGTLIADQTLIAGESLTAYAIGRSADGAFIDNVPVSWSLAGVTGDVVAGDLAVSPDGLSATFQAAAPGAGEITVQGNAATLVGSGVITVEQGPAVEVSVETDADGFGVPLEERFIIVDQTLSLFAISRDAGGNFIETIPATWSLVDAEGDIVAGDLVPAGDGSNAVFTGNMMGTTRIRASVAGLESVDSGIVTVAELVNRWDDGGRFTDLGIAENWFADTEPLFDNTTDLIFHNSVTSRLNPYLGQDRTIRSLNYDADADLFFNIGLTVNGTSGAASLTFDTDSETEPAEINIDADSTGTFRLGRVVAPDLNEYGSIILADDLLITHDGSGTLNIDGDITELDGSRGVTKAGFGTVLMTGTNSYTGDTTVTGGVLSVNGMSLSDSGALVIDGGMVEVQGDEIVAELFIGGVRLAPGVYGSSFSAAPLENQDDISFTGNGTITVMAPPSTGVPEITNISFDGQNFTLTWTSSPGEIFNLFYSLDLVDFSMGAEFGIELDDGIIAGDGNSTEAIVPMSFLGPDVRKAFFRVVRE